MKNAKARILQKVLPSVNHDSIDISIFAALVSLSRRDAKVLNETVKSDNQFSEDAEA